MSSRFRSPLVVRPIVRSRLPGVRRGSCRNFIRIRCVVDPTLAFRQGEALRAGRQLVERWLPALPASLVGGLLAQLSVDAHSGYAVASSIDHAPSSGLLHAAVHDVRVAHRPLVHQRLEFRTSVPGVAVRRHVAPQRAIYPRTEVPVSWYHDQVEVQGEPVRRSAIAPAPQERPPLRRSLGELCSCACTLRARIASQRLSLSSTVAPAPRLRRASSPVFRQGTLR